MFPFLVLAAGLAAAAAAASGERAAKRWLALIHTCNSSMYEKEVIGLLFNNQAKCGQLLRSRNEFQFFCRSIVG